jgi:hypothetical protein
MHGTRLAGLLGFCGCFLSGSAPLLLAAASAAEVEAKGPAECPDSAELGFRVERNVGVPLAQAPALRFEIEMERTANAYAARLRAITASGEGKQRALSGTDCAELADALVVAMTLALGRASATPDAPPPGVEAPQAAPPAETSTASAATPGDSAAEQPLEAETERSRVRPSLSLAVALDAGSLPDPGLGAVLGLELSWQRLQVRGLATLLFEQHTQLGSGTGSAPGADLQLFAGTLLGCTTAIGGAGVGLRAPICVGLELGRLSGTGTGVLSPRSGSALWAAPRADASALWCLEASPICFGATLTAAAPLTRSRFALRGIGTVYRPSPVVGRLSLGLGVGFD